MGCGSFQEGILDENDDVFFSPRVSFVRPRRSYHRSSSSLALAFSGINSRKSFSYDKLAQVPIQLTVVKLDGSSFEINIMKSATIYDLKQAVEGIFSNLPTNESGDISWRQVWGHFCLSYGGMKLLNDTERIKDYGIKDGDELRFVRHVSIAYNLIKKRTRRRLDVLGPCTKPETLEEERREVEEDDEESPKCPQLKDGVEKITTTQVIHSSSTVTCESAETVRCESQAIQKRGQPHRSGGGGFIGYFRSFFSFSDKRAPNCSSKVSQVQN